MTGPIDPGLLDQVRADLENDDFGVGHSELWEPDTVVEIVEALLVSNAWHRARVQVTDEDIRGVGLGDPDVCIECVQLDAWLKVNGFAFDSEWGIYRVQPWKIVSHTSAMAHDHIINALAAEVGRAPLDVLDEIAAAGGWTWRTTGNATACHAELEGAVFLGVNVHPEHGKPGDADGCSCVAEPLP